VSAHPLDPDATRPPDPTRRLPGTRRGGRGREDLRPVEITPGVVPFAEGSALITLGDTRVLCAATVEEKVPRWLLGKGRGWVTAEYAMLPRATKQRTPREATQGKQGGRTVEIQRLIGRSLRAVTDLGALGERQVVIDCDVLQADAGTRCAAITGGYVALALACRRLRAERRLKRDPLRSAVAAVSVGVVRGVPLLDLDYSEDGGADVDFNVVMTDAHAFVELQGTAEGAPFTSSTLDQLLVLASTGLDHLFAAQRAALDGTPGGAIGLGPSSDGPSGGFVAGR
jgi:ribonuclease PH